MTVCLLLLLCHGWAGAIGILPLYTGGVVWALATATVAALPSSGGNLHPLLQDVHLCATIGPLVPRAAVV
jgi:hypothetical protein